MSDFPYVTVCLYYLHSNTLLAWRHMDIHGHSCLLTDTHGCPCKAMNERGVQEYPLSKGITDLRWHPILVPLVRTCADPHSLQNCMHHSMLLCLAGTSEENFERISCTSEPQDKQPQSHEKLGAIRAQPVTSRTWSHPLATN